MRLTTRQRLEAIENASPPVVTAPARNVAEVIAWYIDYPGEPLPDNLKSQPDDKPVPVSPAAQRLLDRINDMAAKMGNDE